MIHRQCEYEKLTNLNQQNCETFKNFRHERHEYILFDDKKSSVCTFIFLNDLGKLKNSIIIPRSSNFFLFHILFYYEAIS